MFSIPANLAQSRRLPSCWLLVAFLSLVASAGTVGSSAQEIKELPSDHGIEAKQPQVYWHDANSRIDLDSSSKQWAVVIQRNSAPAERVLLPDYIEQVDSIRRSGNDRVVVLADLAAGAHYIGVIATDPAELLDQFWTSAPPGLSPDNRYVVFVRFYPMHGAEGYDDQYRLYDVLGSRAINWPGRPAQDAPAGEIINYDASKAGVPVYPLSAAEVGRDNTNVPEAEVHHLLSYFVWDTNSKRVMFADETNGRVSLVLVGVPSDPKQNPTTLTYALAGDQSPCSAACQSKNIGTLAWNGDSIMAQLLATPENAPDRKISLNLPISRFVAAKD